MAKHKLTVKQIDAYRGQGTLRDGEGRMLRNGRWVLRIQVAGRRRDIGLGGLAVVGLKEARRKADEAREAARRGIVLSSSMTFEQAWQEFWKDKRQTLTNGKHIWQWEQTMAAHALCRQSASAQ